MALDKLGEELGTHEATRSSECVPGGDPCPEELEILESDLKQMAQKILNYRETLPDQIKAILASVLAAQRPLVSEVPDACPSPDVAERDTSSEAKLSEPEDPVTARKVQLLKEKISSNATTMPVILKRMKDCIARIEKEKGLAQICLCYWIWRVPLFRKY
ncbi:hypothetical protein L6164_021112 [Bauhinia variegata]|uniref:Uncharacterized protein n=1 Tax=Bauhinia variegata TaxID=167791 RepID=A0ACB9MX72_BAUVA|nr:hypothetical protein L6164_021112 [Bauhinia variegata]